MASMFYSLTLFQFSRFLVVPTLNRFKAFVHVNDVIAGHTKLHLPQ